ncbi:DDE-type integrase/transposase/recombinase, partial [Aduncisulcus paluster]
CGSKCLLYLDDILVFGKTEEEFCENLKQVCERLCKYNLIMNYRKCKIGVKKVTYLGFTIDAEGRRITEKRLEALKMMKPPSSKKEVQKLIGGLNFVREFIPDYSRRMEPISRLLKEELTHWTDVQQNAWEDIIKALEERIVLAHPKANAKVIVRTDASTTGMGGVLIQEVAGKEEIVSLFAKKFTPAEKKWSTIEQE